MTSLKNLRKKRYFTMSAAAWWIAVGYLIAVVAIFLFLSSTAHKAFVEEKRPTLIISLITMLVFCAGSFLFAKFLFDVKAWIFAIVYVVILLAPIFILIEVASKAFREGKRPTFFSTSGAIFAIFFGGFLFAKFIFGF